MDIANQLRNFCEIHEIKQKDLATRLGISYKTVSGWINNHDTIPLKRLVDISNIYKISIDNLLGISKINNYSFIALDKKIIGYNLRKLRKQNNMSIEQVSKKINISSGTYCDYENGKNLIKTVYLVNLLSIYEPFSIDNLFR